MLSIILLAATIQPAQIMANNTNLPDPNRLAEMCLIKFEQLPKTGKPIPNREWTVLSCIVQYNHSNDAIDIVALGTGDT